MSAHEQDEQYSSLLPLLYCKCLLLILLLSTVNGPWWSVLNRQFKHYVYTLVWSLDDTLYLLLDNTVKVRGL